jgi:hypothetical protein
VTARRDVLPILKGLSMILFVDKSGLYVEGLKKELEGTGVIVVPVEVPQNKTIHDMVHVVIG